MVRGSGIPVAGPGPALKLLLDLGSARRQTLASVCVCMAPIDRVLSSFRDRRANRRANTKS